MRYMQYTHEDNLLMLYVLSVHEGKTGSKGTILMKY